jgi:Domain of Unknown Function with PDB structure (DUF3857)/Transglutaminase-like superfamily
MTLYRRLMQPLLFVLFFSYVAFAGDDWKPIDPTQLALKAPVVEKDADAEVLSWEVFIDDSQDDLVFNHSLRIKVFSERGVESQGKVEIDYLDRYKIKDIQARTIKADGSIIELKKDAIFDRTVVKVSGLKLKAKSFAMPGVEPGAIIEYRYREVHPLASARNLKLYFQRTIPVHQVKYYLKPNSYLGAMTTFTFNGQNPQFTKEKNGFHSTMMTNVPAYREEAHMPPEDKVRMWMLVYYTQESKLDPQRYWSDVGKRLYEGFKPRTKVNDDVRKAATEAVGSATTADEKLLKILEFCRTKIKNVNSDTSGMNAEEMKKLKENNNPGDTLKRGYGDSNDIDCLFIAMATAAGFEARLALMPNRSEFFFDPSFPNTYFLDGGEIAVKVGEQWKFYDPSGKYITIGMLPWGYEGVKALITDSKEPTWVTTPISGPEKSVAKRIAKLKLNEDGSLEGDVMMEYTGHFAVEKKRYNDGETPDAREETLRNLVRSQWGGAELSDLKIENVTDQFKPFIYSFHLKVPGYAQRTGKRLFLPPSFFQQGKSQMFTASQRKHPVYFHYPWSERDEVEISLPTGYELDNAEAPNPIVSGDISWSKPQVAITKDGKTLVFRREFMFGAGGNILFPVTTYENLKRLFDAYHQLDSHAITLKQQSSVVTK